MKETYAKDIRQHGKADTRQPPWRKKDAEGRSLTRQAVTRYDTDGKGTAYNLQRLMERHEGKALTVWVRPGHADLTDWRKLRHEWGASYVRVVKLDGTQKTMILEQWRPREERNGKDFMVYLIPKRSTLVDREQVATDITQEQERMKGYDEDHIEFLWRCRNTLAKEYNAYKWRQVLWTELERRYEGVLRKPIMISIPYIERVDILKVKGYVTSKIDEQKWPAFLKEWHKKQFRVTTAGGRTVADILTNVGRRAERRAGRQAGRRAGRRRRRRRQRRRGRRGCRRRGHRRQCEPRQGPRRRRVRPNGGR